MQLLASCHTSTSKIMRQSHINVQPCESAPPSHPSWWGYHTSVSDIVEYSHFDVATVEMFHTGLGHSCCGGEPMWDTFICWTLMYIISGMADTGVRLFHNVGHGNVTSPPWQTLRWSSPAMSDIYVRSLHSVSD